MQHCNYIHAVPSFCSVDTHHRRRRRQHPFQGHCGDGGVTAEIPHRQEVTAAQHRIFTWKKRRRSKRKTISGSCV